MNKEQMQAFFSPDDRVAVNYDDKLYTNLSFNNKTKIEAIAENLQIPFREVEEFLIETGIISPNWQNE